jgi:hypothetical protein
MSALQTPTLLVLTHLKGRTAGEGEKKERLEAPGLKGYTGLQGSWAPGKGWGSRERLGIQGYGESLRLQKKKAWDSRAQRLGLQGKARAPGLLSVQGASKGKARGSRAQWLGIQGSRAPGKG